MYQATSNIIAIKVAKSEAKKPTIWIPSLRWYLPVGRFQVWKDSYTPRAKRLAILGKCVLCILNHVNLFLPVPFHSIVKDNPMEKRFKMG
jgi:hypothetical protein